MDRILIVAFVTVIGGSLCACSVLPRVVVLHDPLTPEEHVTLGLAYEVEGRPELAAREYDGALRKKQGYVPALIGLGNLAFDRGALTEAEAYYCQALITAPEDPGVNNNLAMVYLTQQEKLDEAERLAILALAQGGPLQPYVLDTLAHIYTRQGRYREAKAILEDAQAMAPSEDKVLRERLIRLRDQLGGIDSQAGKSYTGETAGSAKF
jgi:tetratricopeptide (TPR) repeat protein